MIKRTRIVLKLMINLLVTQQLMNNDKRDAFRRAITTRCELGVNIVLNSIVFSV